MPEMDDTAARLLFLEGRAEEARARLLADDPGSSLANLSLVALSYEAEGRFQEAADVWGQHLATVYQAGYGYLLCGAWSRVQPYWQQVLERHPGHWCLTLLGLVQGNLQTVPTMLQLRTHLEVDIANLIRGRQPQMLMNLLGQLHLLAESNAEVFKFAGRALLHNPPLLDRQTEQAGALLNYGQQLLPVDAEVYYHLAEWRLAMNQAEAAKPVLKQCLLMNAAYVPARDMLDALEATGTAS